MYTSVISLGETAKGARIFLEGKWLLRSGFEPAASFEVEIEKDRVLLRQCETGTRRVSGKKQNTIPVIDIENKLLQHAFAKAAKLQVCARNHTITITPAHTAQMVAQRKLTMTEGSMFSGGGLLSEAAAQLGFQPKFAVEVMPEYADIFSANHPTADMFNCSVEQVAYDSLRAYAPLGLLTLGIPCEPFSNVRTLNKGTQEKRDRSLPPEAHENGDMVYFALRAIEATNPSVAVIENVPNFLKSGAGFILQNALRRMGYHVDAKVISPVDYGELTTRKRAVLIARTDGPVLWPVPIPFSGRTIQDILEPDEVVKGEWFDRESKAWLFHHWEQQTAKGNGFAGQVVTAQSTSVGTLKKRYLAQQGDSPVLAHPTKEGVYRFFTLRELMRLAGLRADYSFDGVSKTTSGEVIGQGVVVSTMREIIALNVGMREIPKQVENDSLISIPTDNIVHPKLSSGPGQLALFCFDA
jgi:DNA (cytosine-5)-methyltransferase 1